MGVEKEEVFHGVDPTDMINRPSDIVRASYIKKKQADVVGITVNKEEIPNESIITEM